MCTHLVVGHVLAKMLPESAWLPSCWLQKLQLSWCLWNIRLPQSMCHLNRFCDMFRLGCNMTACSTLETKHTQAHTLPCTPKTWCSACTAAATQAEHKQVQPWGVAAGQP